MAGTTDNVNFLSINLKILLIIVTGSRLKFSLSETRNAQRGTIKREHDTRNADYAKFFVISFFYTFAQLSLESAAGGLAQLARACDWQSQGQGFDSPNLHDFQTR